MSRVNIGPCRPPSIAIEAKPLSYCRTPSEDRFVRARILFLKSVYSRTDPSTSPKALRSKSSLNGFHARSRRIDPETNTRILAGSKSHITQAKFEVKRHVTAIVDC